MCRHMRAGVRVSVITCYSSHMRSAFARTGSAGKGFVCALAAAVSLIAALAAQTSGVHPLSGRRIAPVMGYQGADWLERPERMEEEDPETALNVLRIRPGDAVADIGAGSGYMTVRLAKR